MASYGGIAAVLSAFAGEALRPLAWVGLALAFTGGILTARTGSDSEVGRTGRRDAAASALLYGISLWLQGDFVVPGVGFWVPVWSYYVLGSWSC